MFVWTPPTTNQAVFSRRLEMFKLLLEPFPEITLWMPEPAEIAASISQSHRVMNKARWLRDRFGADAFHEIYFSSDVTGDFTPQSCFQAFPEAERISYGDAMGIGYTLKSFEKELFRNNSLQYALTHPQNYFRNHMVWLKRRLTLPMPWQRLEATTSCMILPCDQYGDFLPGKKQVEVPFAIVQQVLDKLSAAIEKTGIIAPLLEQIKDEAQPYMLLLGSFSESRLCSAKEEISLYQDVISEHIPEGALIILKPHPASRAEKLAELAKILNGRYRTLVVDNEINDIPIELLPDLVKPCNVLSFSYSSVSLGYLYGTTLLHVMTDYLISKHISPANRKWMKDGNDLYLSLINKYG